MDLITYVFFFVRSLWNHRAPQSPRGGKGALQNFNIGIWILNIYMQYITQLP